MKKEPQLRLLTFLVVAHQLSADHHDAGHNKQSVAINEAEVG